ncbi:l-allo-threonine aldolase [Aspergillus sergii]|uniref:L-allo-threonine aldolase n=1 Tax=Aspergillus sergii TaxID=1034303 RepID=A0A5N6XJ88_9EURO|nr:l-allo-threonine aldolase [Aspergillus sergii]
MAMQINDSKEQQHPPHPGASNGLEAKTSQHQVKIPDALRETLVSSDLAWSHANEASNDFRSDTYTKPSMPMLEAIIATSLGDGDTDEDVATRSLEEYIADLVGHEASLLVASGTMGNQVAHQAALKTPPYSILADARGHFHTFECGGASYLTGASVRQVFPSNGHHLTLEDVKREATLRESIYEIPTRVISLENTLNGTIMPLSDVRAISEWAHAQDPPIHLHLDGARVWEAVVAGAFTLREIGAYFDSIQLCFTKGVGAPLGSIVTGSSTYIKRARWSRKFLGGGMRATGLIAASARVAVDDVFFGGKMKAAQEKAKYASDLWQQLGGKLAVPTETNIVWFDLEASGLTYEDFYPLAKRFDLKFRDLQLGRLVFHYQISQGALDRLGDFFRAVLH